jgi:hypothetical protein
MADLKCKYCNCESLSKLGWENFSAEEQKRTNLSALHISRSKSPHEFVVKSALFGASTAAKWAFSEVYRCDGCLKTQRRWFK